MPAIWKAASDESTEWNLPSNELHRDVDDREPAERTLAHRLEDALLDRRDPLARDHPTDDRVLEREALPARPADGSRSGRPRTARDRRSA
jgi:hypothetical protein